MDSNKTFIGCGIVVIVILVLAIVGVLFVPLLILDLPTTIGKSDSIQVFILQPVFGSKLEVKKPVGLYSEAVGISDIQKMELWVDDHLWETGASASPAGKSMSANWSWTPLEEGAYTLMVRATNAEGETANSNPIQVMVVAEVNLPKPEPLAQNELPPVVPLDPTLMTPPEGGASGGMAGGEIPPPPPFPPEEKPPVVEDDEIPGKYWLPIKLDLMWQGLVEIIIGNQQSPNEPKIYAKIEGCDVTLTIKDNSENESGFVIERVSPGSPEYKQIAVLDARVGTGTFKYVDAGVGFGKYVYAVYAVNSAGKTMGNLKTINSTDQLCQLPAQTSLGIVGAKIIPTKSVSKMYCYLSVDGSAWTRIPPNANTFIYGTNGEFDFSPHLGNLIINPPPGGVTLELDCWGWDGGTLIHLGTTIQKVDSGKIKFNSDLIKIIGEAKKQYWMNGEGNFPPNSHIPAPINFHFAQNTDECAKFAAILYPQSKVDPNNWCKFVMSIGLFPVIWDWQPDEASPCDSNNQECLDNWKKSLITDIDGFNLYYTCYSNSPTKIQTANNPFSRMDYITQVTNKGCSKVDYIIRAYKGIIESADSNRINLASPPGTLHKVKLLRYTYSLSESGLSIGQQGPYKDNKNISVGYYYDGGVNNTGIAKDVAVSFDMLGDGALSNKPGEQLSANIVKATIYWDWESHSGDGAGLKLFQYACKNTLNNANGKIQGYPLNGVYGYDVTPQIRSLLQQKFRIAEFIIKSGMRAAPDQTQANSCVEYYGNFNLEIVAYE